MFGYIVVNSEILSKENKQIYRSCYCGLCHCLNEKYSFLGRKHLTYDFTFIAMLLSSLYQKETKVVEETCTLHPLIKHRCQFNELYDYCCDMNMYLSYYKIIDDLNDTKKNRYQKQAQKFNHIISRIENNYPEKTKLIRDKLEQINQFENDNILNADLPANKFGELMAELFVVKEDEYSQTLRQFGYHLGRFIYLLDAIIDLKKDIKNQNYNPLIRVNSKDFHDILLMVMEEVNQAYQKLNLKEYKEIFDNIIYSGIFSAYQIYIRKQELFK